MFRGREQSRPELGFRLLQRLAEDVGELGYVEATPKQDGRNMTMVLAPNKKPNKKAPRANQEAHQARRSRPPSRRAERSARPAAPTGRPPGSRASVPS